MDMTEKTLESREVYRGRILRVPFDEAVELCMSGELTDAKTVAAILKAKVLLGR